MYLTQKTRETFGKDDGDLEEDRGLG